MDKTNILIITSTFPFLPGEHFIEDEIPYWESAELFSEIVIMPWSAEGHPRQISDRIKIDKTLAVKSGKMIRYFNCLLSFFYPFLYKELLYLLMARKMTASNVRRLLAYASSTILSYRRLKHFFKGKSGYTVYTYWNDVQAYGAALAKKSGLVDTLVSRAHGFDVYENKRPDSYMPLKRQFAKYFDSIFVLSEEAEDYMQSTYGIPPHILTISPLGVPLPSYTSSSSEPGEVNIVSVSFCVPVKRIDKLIDAIALFADRYPHLRINWRHIGGGVLFDELNEYASLKLAPHKNIGYNFLGLMPNEEVKNFYLHNNTDMFVNTSESEGMPVSIMEAMAAGVPAIAPNVGGIADLVTNECGVLMSEDPSIEEIANAIGDMAEKARRPDYRIKARERIESRFNAAKNYPEFIERLHAMSIDDPDVR